MVLLPKLRDKSGELVPGSLRAAEAMTHCLNASKVILNAWTSFDLRILAKVQFLIRLLLLVPPNRKTGTLKRHWMAEKKRRNITQMHHNLL